MKWAKVKAWVYRVGLFLGALIFLIQVVVGIQAFNPSNVPAGFWRTALWSIAGMALVVGLQIVNWRILLRSVGVGLPLLALARGYVLSNLPKYIPGSIWGYLSRGQWLNQDHGIAFAITNLANLFELEVTLVSAGSVILLGLAISEGSITYLVSAILLPVAALLLTRTFVRLLKNKGWFGLSALSGSFRVASRYLWFATLVSLVEWLILGVVILLLLIGSVSDGSWAVGWTFLKDWMLAVQSFTLAWLGGFFVIFVPGGLGIRELALTGLLMANFSPNNEAATLVSISSRLFYSLGELIWLGIGLLLKVTSRKPSEGKK